MPTVVVTGLGATTPLGGDVASTWEAMLDGRSGVKYLTDESLADLPVRIGAPVAVDPSEVLDRVQARRMDRFAQLAVVASREAWQHAGAPEVEPERLGVVIGSGIGGLITTYATRDTLTEKGARRVSPLAIPMLMPNSAAGYVGIELGARAGVHTTVSACASGAEAIGYAVDMIKNGRADIVVAGGTEACLIDIPLAAFAAMKALSSRNDDPERASRPYDIDRDGFVLAEGAGIVVLESAEHAASRGATVYATIAGAGYSADGHHLTQPEPTGRGAMAAMRQALTVASLTPEDIVHVNAHATATPLGDVGEAKAIRNVLGAAADNACVSATKSMTGHTLGAAGAIETIACVLAMYERIAPPTINLDNLDPGVDLDIVRGEARKLPSGDIAALNNSFGFGGHNVALVIASA